MFVITHIGHGPLTELGTVLTFDTAQAARDYLAASGQLGTLGVEWIIEPISVFAALMASGGIFMDELGHYVGIASDGVHCVLGKTHHFVESYLSVHPTPDTW